MQDIGCKLSRMAAVVVIFLAVCVGSAWAQIPWQTGDLVACYGTGNGGGRCNVFRIDNTNNINFLNSLNDNSSAATTATAINNCLHLLVTDGGSGTSSVVQYSIASINPFTGATVPHATTTFNSSGGANSNNAQAIAINNGGHMFVGNSGSGGQASIVELDAHGTATGNVYTFSSGACATTSLSSLDLSADGNTIYVTSGDVSAGGDGKIRALDISSGLSVASGCSIFADFGPGVSLFGIKDIPAGALSGNCLVNSCPNGESVLVVANGFVDIDSNETENNPPSSDPDAINVCTNAAGGSAHSCALLLSTAAATPPLSGAVWQAGHIYGTADIGTQIVDAFLHVQKVVSAGKSGADEPAWSQSGGTVSDNAVVWTDQGQKLWGQTTDYAMVFACSQAGLVNNLNDGLAWGVLPIYLTHAGLSVEQVALIAAAYPFSWGVLQLGTGALSDRWGRRPMIVVGMALQALALWAILLVHGEGPWTSAALLLGLGTALVYPTLLAAVSDVAHPTWRASVVGVYRLWRDLGYAVGALLSGIVADLAGIPTAIAVVAGLTLMSAAIAAWRLRETLPGRAPRLKEATS